MQRPSKKELFGKLRNAKAAVNQGNIFLIDQDVIAEDAIELGYDIGDELRQVLAELLEEINVYHYAGARPPQKVLQAGYRGPRAFPFCNREPPV